MHDGKNSCHGVQDSSRCFGTTNRLLPWQGAVQTLSSCMVALHILHGLWVNTRTDETASTAPRCSSSGSATPTTHRCALPWSRAESTVSRRRTDQTLAILEEGHTFVLVARSHRDGMPSSTSVFKSSSCSARWLTLAATRCTEWAPTWTPLRALFLLGAETCTSRPMMLSQGRRFCQRCSHWSRCAETIAPRPCWAPWDTSWLARDDFRRLNRHPLTFSLQSSRGAHGTARKRTRKQQRSLAVGCEWGGLLVSCLGTLQCALVDQAGHA